MKKWLLALLVIAVYLLHQDWWNWKKVEPLVLGFLPIGLAYHAGYSVLAAGMMWLLVRFAWPRDLDNLERETPDRAAGGGSDDPNSAASVRLKPQMHTDERR